MRVPDDASGLEKLCGMLWSFARLSYAESMLPILRILPVGGVLLAILILVLALNPPGGLHPSLPPAIWSARGPLMHMDEHPEWRQFLILAATRRAYELSRLRDLADMPVRSDSAQDAGKFTGLPVERSDADPDDQTGSINEMPSVTIPIDIGETSSTELPMKAPEEIPPGIKTPERVRLPNESRKKSVQRSRRVTVAKPESAAEFNFFETLFGDRQTKQPATGSAQNKKPATVRAGPQ